MTEQEKKRMIRKIENHKKRNQALESELVRLKKDNARLLHGLSKALNRKVQELKKRVEKYIEEYDVIDDGELLGIIDEVFKK